MKLEQKFKILLILNGSWLSSVALACIMDLTFITSEYWTIYKIYAGVGLPFWIILFYFTTKTYDDIKEKRNGNTKFN